MRVYRETIRNLDEFFAFFGQRRQYYIGLLAVQVWCADILFAM